MPTLHHENESVKEVLAGKYRHTYLIYVRKSTDEPNNQRNSITYQKAENVRYSERERLPIAPLTINGFCTDGIVSEKHSAFHEDEGVTITADGMAQYRIERPKFHQLTRYLSLGLFRGVIFLCWDRASRNKGDETVLRKLMRQGVDMRFVFAAYDKTSSGELHMDIDGMFSIHHSRVTREKVINATRELRKNGIVTYRAPIGYLNLGDMRNKPFDPDRAPIIKRVFELYSTGDWSLADLARWAKEQGLTTPPMRRRRTQDEIMADDDDQLSNIPKVARPVQLTHLQKILGNRFYTGHMIDSDGAWIISASHRALVSDDLFEKVQVARRRKNVSIFYGNKLPLLFRGICRCGNCKRAFTPYLQKGIMYLGSRCKTGCHNTQKHLPLSLLEEKVGKLISNLAFTDEELIALEANTKADITQFEHQRRKDIEQSQRHDRKIREDLEYLRTNKLTLLQTGVYTPQDFLKEETRLSSELASVQVKQQASDASMHEVIKEVIKISELLKNVAALYTYGNSQQKDQIVRIIFSELTMSGNTLQYKCKTGFAPFESRFHPVCGPITWISEIYRNSTEVVGCRKSLSELLTNQQAAGP